MIIGICGGSGSGKTTLLNKLADEFRLLQPTLFSLDNYYKPLEEQQKDENGITNFDLPTALYEERAAVDLFQLKQGESVTIKEYFFNANRSREVLLTLEPSRLIIVEGLFIFHYPSIRALMDYTLFVEVDLEVQLDRRLYRDQETRGYSREDVLYQWHHHVLPCYQKYLEPYRHHADFRFKNGRDFDQEFLRLRQELSERLVHEP